MRRLQQFEALYAPVVPNVIERDDEDLKSALARHVERYGRAPPSYVVVPTRCNEAELPELEIQWAEQQRNLIVAAKSERKEHDDEHSTEHRTQQDGRRSGSSMRTSVA